MEPIRYIDVSEFDPHWRCSITEQLKKMPITVRSEASMQVLESDEGLAWFYPRYKDYFPACFYPVFVKQDIQHRRESSCFIWKGKHLQYVVPLNPSGAIETSDGIWENSQDTALHRVGGYLVAPNTTIMIHHHRTMAQYRMLLLHKDDLSLLVSNSNDYKARADASRGS